MRRRSEEKPEVEALAPEDQPAPKKPKKQLNRKRGVTNPITGKGRGIRQKSPKQTLQDLQDQKVAAELIVRGLTMAKIAERLGCTVNRVSGLLARAMDEYLGERDDVVAMRFGIGLSRYDAIISAYMHRALGYKDENGKIHDPDKDAAQVVLRAQRDADRLINYGQSIRVEHTGAGGGPIVTQTTGDPLDIRSLIAIVRESNPDAVTPDVMLGEGEPVPDVLPVRH